MHELSTAVLLIRVMQDTIVCLNARSSDGQQDLCFCVLFL